MFGLLISGRLVDTGFREVDATHAVIDVLDADNFNHVVVSSMYLIYRDFGRIKFENVTAIVAY